MWQVDFYYAIEREHERQRELERKRRLGDAVRSSTPTGHLRPLLRRALAAASEVKDVVGSVLGRPLVGPHHS